jgi:HEAT repeat protein
MKDYSFMINQLLTSAISIKNFTRSFPKGTQRYTRIIIDLLESAYDAEEADSIEFLIIAANQDGLNTEYTKVLCKLLESSWHSCHEDIAMSLESIRDPSSVESLYDAISFESPEDTNYFLARKCLWALRAIGNQNAIDKLILAKASPVAMISETAILQLKSLGIT